MKTLKNLISHAATVISVMIIVFLSINVVNVAMRFYDHRYTKCLLAALCVLTFLCAVRLRKLGSGQAVLIFAGPALWEAGVLIYSRFDGGREFFADLGGQISAWILALSALTVSVWLTAKQSRVLPDGKGERRDL